MKKKFYKCTDCEQKFGRRWNAQRHSITQHSAASEIIGNDIKPNISNISQNKYINYNRKFIILNRAGIDIWNEYEGSDIFELNEEDFKIIKIIDQLIKPFNELEDLLKDYAPKIRAFILSKSFDASLQSHNPVNAMNEMVELFRSINGIKKIAKYNSLIDKTSEDPITDVKNKIINSKIFKRQNN